MKLTKARAQGVLFFLRLIEEDQVGLLARQILGRLDSIKSKKEEQTCIVVGKWLRRKLGRRPLEGHTGEVLVSILSKKRQCHLLERKAFKKGG